MFFTVKKNYPKQFLSLLINYTLLADMRVVLQRVSRKMFWLNQTQSFPGMGAGAATKRAKDLSGKMEKAPYSLSHSPDLSNSIESETPVPCPPQSTVDAFSVLQIMQQG